LNLVYMTHHIGETKGLRQEIKKMWQDQNNWAPPVSKDTLNVRAQSLRVALRSGLRYVGVKLIFSLKVKTNPTPKMKFSFDTGPHTKVHKVFDSEDEIPLSNFTKFRRVNSM